MDLMGGRNLASGTPGILGGCLFSQWEMSRRCFGLEAAGDLPVDAALNMDISIVA